MVEHHLPIAEAGRRGPVEQTEADRRPFVAETVFSHPSKIDLIREAKAAGYVVALHVIIVPKNLSTARVRQRVAEGGHSVPPDKISARYDRLWALVAAAIELVDEGVVYDTSSQGSPRTVARIYDCLVFGSTGWPTWAPQVLTERWAA